MSDTSSARARGSLPRRDLLVKGGAAAAAAAVGATVVGAGTASAAPLAPLLVPVTPERLYDSREASGRLNSAVTRTLVGSDPAGDDLAYLLNVTVTDTIGQGFVSVFSADDVWPGNSTVNWSAPGQSIANTAYTWIRASDRGINVRAGGPGSTQFVLDLTAVLLMVDLAAFNPTAIASNGALATPQGSGRALTEASVG